MTELNKFKLATTFSGRTYKFQNVPAANLLIDLPNNFIIGITSSISCIECYIPDKEQIYHYAGDLNLTNYEGDYSINFHSRAISALSFNDSTVPIPSDNSNLCNVKISLELDKSIHWFNSIKSRI